MLHQIKKLHAWRVRRALILKLYCNKVETVEQIASLHTTVNPLKWNHFSNNLMVLKLINQVNGKMIPSDIFRKNKKVEQGLLKRVTL